MKKLIPIIILIVAIVLIIKIFSNKKGIEIQKQSIDKANKSQIIEKKPSPEELRASQINYLKGKLLQIKQFDNSKYSGDFQSIESEVDIIEQFAYEVGKSIASTDDSIKLIGADMQKALKALQIKEFPRLRKEYAKISKQLLWEKDIEVKNYGTAFTTLEFTGALFAANANKQQFQETLSRKFFKLRFKKIIYKWYEYDDRYTYYTLTPPSDSEIYN